MRNTNLSNNILHNVLSVELDAEVCINIIDSFFARPNFKIYLFCEAKLMNKSITTGFPIHKAAMLPHSKLVYVRLLSNFSREQCQGKDSNGSYPLDYALVNGNEHAIKVLLAYSAPYHIDSLLDCQKKYPHLRDDIELWIKYPSAPEVIKEQAESECLLYGLGKEPQEMREGGDFIDALKSTFCFDFFFKRPQRNLLLEETRELELN